MDEAGGCRSMVMTRAAATERPANVSRKYSSNAEMVPACRNRLRRDVRLLTARDRKRGLRIDDGAGAEDLLLPHALGVDVPVVGTRVRCGECAVSGDR